MANKYKSLVDPAFHGLLMVPPVNYDNFLLLKFIRFYARLNYQLSFANTGVSVKRHTVNIDNVRVSVDHFKNTTLSGLRPCLLYFHGGGFAMPAFGYQKKLLSEYALGAHCDVLSVDYSLSPEAKSDKILGESFAAIKWLVDHTKDLSIDCNKIAVGGDSAGGCLAASVTQFCADHLEPRIIKFQLLIYPVLDNAMSTESMKLFPDTAPWSGEATKTMWEKYLGQSEALATSYAVPMKYQDFSILPPAYIENAEVDPLRDEALQYAEKLKSAGVPVDLHQTKGTPHGYDCLLNTEKTRTSISRRIDALKKSFGL